MIVVEGSESFRESKTRENVDKEKSFHGEVVINFEEYMEIEPHYSEQRGENQCNGDVVFEIHSCSQGKDDMESHEEDKEGKNDEKQRGGKGKRRKGGV